MQTQYQGEFEEGAFVVEGRSGQRARQARHEQARRYVDRALQRSVDGDGFSAVNGDGPGYRGLRSGRQPISEPD